jgi:hypothetical protein
MVSEIRTYCAPESPAGIGEADGFAPPKRPLKIAAAMAMGMSCNAKGCEETKLRNVWRDQFLASD